MPARTLRWRPSFQTKYRRLQDEAVKRLKAGDDKPLKRFLRVGDTLRALATCAAPPEDERRLNSGGYVEASRIMRSGKRLYGSRIRAEPADYRIFWRYSAHDDRCLELVDLIWPCL